MFIQKRHFLSLANRVVSIITENCQTTLPHTQINFVMLIGTFPYLFHPSDPSQEPGNLLCTSLAHKNEHPGIRVYPGATAIPALHLKALLSNNCVLVLVMSFHRAERGT